MRKAEVTKVNKPNFSTHAIAILALIISWLFLIPILPVMPSSGLDPSWRYALNVALSQGLNFGQDVIFTLGPLGSVYSQIYSPETDAITLVGSAVYGAAFCVMLWLISYPRRLLAIVLVPLIIPLNTMRDAFFLAMPFMLLLNGARMCVPKNVHLHLAPSKTVFWCFALATIALGMMPLIKGSFSGVVFPISALIVLVLAQKDIRLSIGFLGALVGSIAAWWIICGQPIANLLTYFLTQLPSISGYTEAMSVNNQLIGPIIYVAASITICYVLFIQFRNQGYAIRWSVILGAAWSLFVSFKSGFVRHDAHALISAGTFLFIAYSIGAVSDARRAAFIALIATASSISIAHTIIPAGIQFLRTQFQQFSLNSIDGLKYLITRPEKFHQEYEEAVEQMRQEEPLPHVSGTVDIYPTELAAIFANGLHWSGRPVFQSYAAYTPDLLIANAQHLTGPKGARTIFFTFGPIDDRLPSLDDSNSILTLLENYKIVDYKAPYIQMEKSTANGTHLVESDAREADIGWNEDLRLEHQRPMWVRIDVRHSVLGRIVETLFKLPQIEIDLHLSNGTVVHHRFISGIGRSGFILSPYLTTAKGLVGMAAGLSVAPSVTAFKLLTHFPSLWERKIAVTLTPIDIATQPNLRSLIVTEPVDRLPSDFFSKQATPTKECNIDTINGKAYHGGDAQRNSDGVLSVEGWIAPEQWSDAGVFNTWIVSISEDGRKHYFKTTTVRRTDVATFLKRPDLISSGFSVNLDGLSLTGRQTLSILAASNTNTYQCEILAYMR